MKKKLLACAVLFATIPAYAYEIPNTGLEVYGSLRLMIEQTESDGENDLKDAASRVGIKGSYDLSADLSAFAKYEVALDLANNDTVGDMRYGHLGLKHQNYGTFAVGKVDAPFYETVGYYSDYMWWNSAPVYYTLDGVLRLEDALYYSSADLGGLNIKALQQIGNDEEGTEDISQLGATYTLGNLTVGAGASLVDGDENTYGVSASYSQDAFYINGAYLDRDGSGSGIDALIGFPSGKNLYTLGLSDFQAENSDEDFTAAILAYQHSLHDQVLLWAEFMAWDGSLYGVEDSNQLNVGVNFNF
ncbi:hypothetical protein GCM10009104_32530 [Marinobacterium maritimum]|uniref:Porin domain-containing protein n=1 Tax=Marinobacterium maritimum TaxID=500162 RepID=A0ABP3TGK1_9GAMM